MKKDPMLKKTYCYNCDSIVDITIKEMPQNFKINGYEIDFMAEEACCNKCNNKVSVSFLDDNIVKTGHELFIKKISERNLDANKKSIAKRKGK